MSEARLHNAEATHGTTGKIVRANRYTFDVCVLTPVRPLGVGHCIDKHSR